MQITGNFLPKYMYVFLSLTSSNTDNHILPNKFLPLIPGLRGNCSDVQDCMNFVRWSHLAFPIFRLPLPRIISIICTHVVSCSSSTFVLIYSVTLLYEFITT